MAEPLGVADFALAFDFARSEAVAVLDAAGLPASAEPDVAAFDHTAAGVPLGLLVIAGTDLGGGDRVALDPLMLPIELVSGEVPGDRDATVFHRFDAGAGEARRAWYTRHAQATVEALLDQPGHHREIGVVAGFRRNDGGLVRYRGEIWTLPELLSADGIVLADTEDRPVIRAGTDPE